MIYFRRDTSLSLFLDPPLIQLKFREEERKKQASSERFM